MNVDMRGVKGGGENKFTYILYIFPKRPEQAKTNNTSHKQNNTSQIHFYLDLSRTLFASSEYNYTEHEISYLGQILSQA